MRADGTVAENARNYQEPSLSVAVLWDFPLFRRYFRFLVVLVLFLVVASARHAGGFRAPNFVSRS